MAKIISISTAVPQHVHKQQAILQFMERSYDIDEKEKRILRYLYNHSGIETRYSVIPDYTSSMEDWQFFPKSEKLEPFPNLELRMRWFQQHACKLSVEAAEKCINGYVNKNELTHLITVSCTGMSAPGLELQVMEAMGLNSDIHRTAINFMGCYAAIHALKQAADIIGAHHDAKVLIVCTELCTLHFQKTFTEATVTAPLLFADGCAAVLVTADTEQFKGIHLNSFYSETLNTAKNDMDWSISSMGFLMTLSARVPELFRNEILPLKKKSLVHANLDDDDIRYWCIHPGGKRILESIAKGLALNEDDLASSYNVLRNYGNMSSPTILFVLKDMWNKIIEDVGANIFGVAFGPGLTMESMIMTVANVNSKPRKQNPERSQTESIFSANNVLIQ